MNVDVIPIWDKSEEFWHRERARGLGGSDIGILLGFSKYTSPLALWMLKTGKGEKEDAGDAAAWGNILEGPVAAKYAAEEGVAMVEWPVILRSKKTPWMQANVDRFIVEPSEQFPAGVVTPWHEITEPPGILALYEGKTGGIVSPGFPKLWDDNAIPDSYACQGYWYMAVTGLRRVEYGALIGGRGLQKRTLLWDQTVAMDIYLCAQEFWTHVVTGEPPEADGSESTVEALKSLYPKVTRGEVVEADEELTRLWREYRVVKVEAKIAEARAKELNSQIKLRLGNAEWGYIDGEPAMSFKGGDGTVEWFDEKGLQRDDPSLWKKYRKTKPSPRALREVG